MIHAKNYETVYICERYGQNTSGFFFRTQCSSVTPDLPSYIAWTAADPWLVPNYYCLVTDCLEVITYLIA